MIKQWVVFTLLTSFLVLWTPRELWHDCDQHTDHADRNELSISQKECFACDFELCTIDSPVQINSFSFERFYVFVDAVRSEIPDLTTLFTRLHRGPPTV